MVIERLGQGKPCSYCGSTWHTAWSCPNKPRKPMNRGTSVLKAKKPMKRIGKEGERYRVFRDTIAYPYLVKKFGEQCAICKKPGPPLDVDHIKKRGSHRELKYELKNLQLLCRKCHWEKDNEYKGEHGTTND